MKINFVNLACSLICSGMFLVTLIILFNNEFMELIDWVLFIVCLYMSIVCLVRENPRNGKFRMIDITICSLSMVYFWLFDLSSYNNTIIVKIGELMAMLGGLIWSFSMIWLSRSFSILPTVRSIKTNGPYAIVRHPIYLSYIIMDTGLLIAYPEVKNLMLVFLACGFYLWRLISEERILIQTETYNTYCRKVQYRLIPGLY